MPAPLPHLAAALQARSTIRVLAIGASSTLRTSPTSGPRNYPAKLESILERAFAGLDVIIINRGVSGEVAATTAERLKVQVALEKPQLVLWQVGTNDALARVPAQEFAETVRDTVQWLKEHQIDTVLVGLQYALRVSKDDDYLAIRRALREVANTENVPLVRRFEAMQFIEESHDRAGASGEEARLDDPGYECMAEHIARAMVVSAFLRKAKGTEAPPVKAPQP
jgi:acyl-CoA thioesterase I